MSLIEDILKASRDRLAERKKKHPHRELKTKANSAPRADISFLDALQKDPFSVIAEVKHRSPTKGAMDPQNVERALDVYLACPSVSAISILTDEDHFGGSIDHLRKARRLSKKPLLRKDFIFDEYQVLEARACGADAILLMAGLHKDRGLVRALFDLATSLKMDVLFEIGMSMRPIEEQPTFIPPDAAIVGINSRKFSGKVGAQTGRLFGKELTTDLGRHREFFGLIPPGKLAIAESGIESPGDLGDLERLGYRAALIGTALLKKGVSVEESLRGFDSRLRGRSNTSIASAFSPDMVTSPATT